MSNSLEQPIWLASIDIGKKNFAFYIEECDKNKLLNIKNIPKTRRYNVDGTCTEVYKNIIDSVSLNGKVILYKNCDITDGCKKDAYFDCEILYNLTELLDSYIEYWDKCEAIVIEQQMSFGKKNNTMALKIGQHCWSYFGIRYSRFKKVIEFPSYNKTQILGAPKVEKRTKKGKVSYVAMEKPARKKWSVERATTILADRDDFKTLSQLTSQRKKDDLADVLCQLQAYKYLEYVKKSV